MSRSSKDFLKKENLMSITEKKNKRKLNKNVRQNIKNNLKPFFQKDLKTNEELSIVDELDESLCEEEIIEINSIGD
ncbi:hypothetical protein M0R19_03310 [Candidatus Pacearchaeota archaeon]|jgi:hypothetical protein|nr:hypothetical protein [Candidatus Pacearchaeota archaeon]